jgi:hypothetical protein
MNNIMTNETGLVVITNNDTKADLILGATPFYFEYDSIENFFFFPELEQNFDSLEMELDKIFNQNEISARFEGQS